MTTPTTNYGWAKPVDGGDFDIWGVELNALFDAVDAQMKATDNKAAYAAPTGMVAAFDMASAPIGWVIADGGTIGDALSGAGRANADTAALFAVQWGFSNTLRPILNSDGTAGSRGGSAAADYAAHKRIPVGNIGNRVVRGIGADAPALGDVQADAFQGHEHDIPSGDSSSGGSNAIARRGDVSIDHTVNTGSVYSDGSDGSPRVATETRVKSYGVLWCIKL